jgi:hypothetical protein
MVDAQEEGSSLLEEPKLGFQTCKLGNTTVDGSKCLLAMNNFNWAVGIVKLFSVYHYKRLGIWILLKPAYVRTSIFFILNLFSLG